MREGAPVAAVTLDTQTSPHPAGSVSESTLNPSAAPESGIDAVDPAMSRKIRELPRDVGVMLVAVGACGMVLPGMVGGPAILAGGLALWPRAFGRVESWFGRKFPRAHREGMRQIGRYLDDLDRRYSYTQGDRDADASVIPAVDPNLPSPTPRSEQS